MKMSKSRQLKESLALQNIVALGKKALDEGKTKSFRAAFADIRARIRKEGIGA